MRTVNSTTIATKTLTFIKDVMDPAIASGALTNREAMVKITKFMYNETRSGAYQVWGYDIPFGHVVSMAADNCHVSLKLRHIGSVTLGTYKTKQGLTKVITNVTDVIAGLKLVVKADGLANDADVIDHITVREVEAVEVPADILERQQASGRGNDSSLMQ